MLQLLLETNEKTTSLDELKNNVRLTNESFQQAIDELVEEGVISIKEDTISLSLEQRLSLATKAINVGADLESVSLSLHWLEFEELSARVFSENHFNVSSRFRFTAEGRRWEIDILATRSPYIICAECKHWSRGIGNQTARNIIEAHIEKVEVFSKNVESLRGRIGLRKWMRAIIVPITLTLSSTPFELYRRVPSVSVLALPRFIEEFDGQLERLTNYKIKLSLPKQKLKQMVLKKKNVSGSKRVRHQ